MDGSTEMKVSIMQPNLFMWNGLVKQLCDSDIHIILDHVKGSKNSRYNRNRISGNGNPCWLTIPMKNFSRNNAINTIMLDTSKRSIQKVMDTFCARYINAPRFENSYAILSSTISNSSDETNIIAIYRNFLAMLKNSGIPICKTVLSSEILDREDYNNINGIDLVNHLITEVSGSTYLAAENTASYATSDDYNIQDVKIQKFIYMPYSQGQSNYIPENFVTNLSCLDTLSFMSIEDFLEYIEASNSWRQL